MREKTPELSYQDCQMQTIPEMQKEMGSYLTPRLPLLNRVRLFFRRHLDLDTRRKLKRFLFINNFWQSRGGNIIKLNDNTSSIPAVLNLKAGDTVRVRSKEEILATLDSEGKLKGCGFLNVMWQYCGTTQTVFKPVTRFVDERNYRIKNARHMVLLEGVMCTGTDFYGNCDRSCFYFWREEWLEKI